MYTITLSRFSILYAKVIKFLSITVYCVVQWQKECSLSIVLVSAITAQNPQAGNIYEVKWRRKIYSASLLATGTYSFM